MKQILLALLLLFALVPGALATANPDLTDNNGVSLAPSIIGSSDPGSPFTQTVKVKNLDPTEQFNATFQALTLTHSSGSGTGKTISATIPSPITNIAVGGSSSATTLTITPSTTNFAGTYNGNFVVHKTGDSSTKDTVPVTFTVNPKPLMTASMGSLIVGQGTSNTVTLTLTNTGNTDLTVTTLNIPNLISGSNSLPNTVITGVPSLPFTIPFSQPVKTITLTVNPIATQAVATYTGVISSAYGGLADATTTMSVQVRVADHNVVVNGSLDFGSSSQKKDNTTITKTITIQNTGDFTENVNLDVSNIPSKFKPTLSTTTLSNVAPGSAPQSVTLTVTVPSNSDSGKVKIGDLTTKFNGDTETVVRAVNLETKTFIKVSDIDVKIKDDNDENNLNNNDNFDVKPGDEITFQVEVENLFDKNVVGEDQELRDVEVDIEIDNLDDNDDEEESGDVKDDIKPGKKETAEDIDFFVPNDVDSGDHDVTITVTGEDEDDNKHTVVIQLTMDVNKEDDDVRIERAELTSSTLQCQRSTSLFVDLENFGDDDQDDLRLTIASPDFNLNFDQDDIELDDGDDLNRRVSVVAPSSLSAGEYDIEVRVYYDRNLRKLADSETVRVTVKDCADGSSSTSSSSSSGSSSSSSGGDTSTTGTTTGTTATTTTGATGTVGTLPAGSAFGGVLPLETIEQPLTSSPIFIAMLVLLNVIALGGVVVLAIKLLK